MNTSFYMVNFLKMAALSHPHRVTQPRDFHNVSSWRGQDARQQISWRSDKNPGRSLLNSNASTQHFPGGAVELFQNLKAGVLLSRATVGVYQISCLYDKPVILYEFLKNCRGRCGAVWAWPWTKVVKYKIFHRTWFLCQTSWVFEHVWGVKLGFKEA